MSVPDLGAMAQAASPVGAPLLVDGTNVLFRCVSRTYKASHPYAAVDAFLRLLLSGVQAGDTVVVWDGLRSSSWRRALFPEYKAHRRKHRKEDPEAPLRWAAFSRCATALQEDLLPVCGVDQARAYGFEGDDLLAVLTRRGDYGGATVMSSDSDLAQLLVPPPQRDGAWWWLRPGGDMVSAERFAEERGFPPSRVPVLKALSGDSSDGVPGLAKIGKARAERLVREFSTIGAAMAAARGEAECPGWLKAKSYDALRAPGAVEILVRNLHLVDLGNVPAEIADVAEWRTGTTDALQARSAARDRLAVSVEAVTELCARHASRQQVPRAGGVG